MSDERTLSDKLSGRVRQPVDAGGKKTLEGRILPSSIPRGRISTINMPPLPDGLTVVTAKDIPGKASLRFGSVTVPLFGLRQISWIDQPILAAAGEGVDELDDWISKVELVIKESGSLEPEEDEFIRKKGNPEDAFSRAFQVIEEILTIPAKEGSTEATGATCLRDGNFYHIHSGTSWPGLVRKSVARVLQVPKENITVRPYSSGPGSKSHAEIWHPAMIAATASLLSWKAKRSVRLKVASGDGAYVPGCPGAEFRLRAAVDAEGRLTAIDADISIDVGALLPFNAEIIDRILLGLFSFYPCRNFQISGRVRRNPRAPSTFGPAAGFEIGFFAGELLAAKIADNSLATPVQWRRDSLPVVGQAMGPGILQPKDFPVRKLLGEISDASDFERKAASYEQIRLSRENLLHPPESFRGIGLSLAWFGNGFLGYSKDLVPANLSATLDKSGRLSVSLPPNAPGPLTKGWSAIAGEILGLEDNQVKYDIELPESNIEAGPSILGRHVGVYTRLLELACNDLSKRRFRDPLPIRIDRTKRRGNRAPWNPEHFEGSAFDMYSWGASVVEVSVSAHTFCVESIRIWLNIDGGRLIMPDYARAAVENSADEALNWCMGGREKHLIPHIDIQFSGADPKKTSKDISTLPWLLVPAAFMKAVRQASGVNIDRLPITPERIRSGGPYS